MRRGLAALLVVAGACSVPDRSDPMPDTGPDAERAPPETDASTAGSPSAPSAGGPTRVPFPDPPAGAPEWVHTAVELRSDGAFAVGRAPASANRGLARSIAGNRARARLARALTEAAGPDGLSRKGADESHTSGVAIVAYWTDPASGAIFARAEVSHTTPRPEP